MQTKYFQLILDSVGIKWYKRFKLQDWGENKVCVLLSWGVECKYHTWGLLYAFRTLNPSFCARSWPNWITLSSFSRENNYRLQIVLNLQLILSRPKLQWHQLTTSKWVGSVLILTTIAAFPRVCDQNFKCLASSMYSQWLKCPEVMVSPFATLSVSFPQAKSMGCGSLFAGFA